MDLTKKLIILQKQRKYTKNVISLIKIKIFLFFIRNLILNFK